MEEKIMFKSAKIGSYTLELTLGDITEQAVDAIVNAANAQLAGGGGVDGAIHHAGGSAIMAETRKLYPQGCPTGWAVPTGAGRLNAKFVFHAVGPRWHDGHSGEAEALAFAYRRCLELAVEKSCASIAFPSISTGVYGFPIGKAAKIALQTVVDFLNKNSGTALQTVRFCLFSGNDFKVYESALSSIISAASGGDAKGFCYKNLAVYPIHGMGEVYRFYLTLEEAMEKKLVVIHETGNVGELTADNNSERYIFILSGDIVKGGRQDRTIGEDTILKPHTKQIPLRSFCVEQSRWSRRGSERADQFECSREMANTKTRMATKLDEDQGRVWEEVAEYQEKARLSLGKDVRSRESATSLQLTLENEDVQAAIEAYLQHVQACLVGHDVIGFAFSINGKIQAAEIFGSADLFGKLRAKLLKSAASEAAFAVDAKADFTHPTEADVEEFIYAADSKKATKKQLNDETVTEHQKNSTSEIFKTLHLGDCLHTTIYAR
jgi:O-acetyl-ADP-ribose deacetylase (regulator of RNase III)